ncbi:MAG: methyltransferase [Acidimicrobiales bacterium]
MPAGSFFDSAPAGCDAYVLKSVLHDWDDASSAQILRRVAEVAAAGTALLIAERVVADRSPGAVAVMSDLSMKINTPRANGAHWPRRAVSR